MRRRLPHPILLNPRLANLTLHTPVPEAVSVSSQEMANQTISVFPAAGATALDRLTKLYNDKSTSDVTFTVGPNKTEFFGHTVIIGAASDVFKAHFSGDWKDKKNVNLGDMKEDVFQVLMTYIYTDEITVQKDNLLDVLQLAHLYMMTGLIKSLTNEATFNTYSDEHIWKYLSFAVAINDIELIIRCLKVIDKDPLNALNKSDFLNVETSTIGMFIGSNSLKISESNLFKRLLDWSVYECRRRSPPLHISPANQRKVMDSWIHKIRFPLMTAEEFAVVEKTGILTASEVNLVKNAIRNEKKGMTGFDFNQRVIYKPTEIRCQGYESKYGLSLKIKRTIYNSYNSYNSPGTYTYQEVRVCLACAINCHSSSSFTEMIGRGSLFKCQCKENGLCKF